MRQGTMEQNFKTIITMEKKKGLVIQAKFIEEYKPEDKTFYVYGVGIRWGKTPKEVDAGKFYSVERDQKYFTEGQDVEYMFEKNEKEPKNSRIKPVVAKTTTTGSNVPSNTKGITVDHINLQKLEAIKFSAPYAKDIIVAMYNNGKTPEGLFPVIANEILKWQYEKLEELL